MKNNKLLLPITGRCRLTIRTSPAVVRTDIRIQYGFYITDAPDEERNKEKKMSKEQIDASLFISTTGSVGAIFPAPDPVHGGCLDDVTFATAIIPPLAAFSLKRYWPDLS